MYKNISIFILVSIASFALMIGLGIFGGFFPVRFATAIKIIFLSLFLILAFSIVPVVIWAVLRGNISIWQKLPVSGTGLIPVIRNFIMQNEVRVFYGLLIFFWGIFTVGLAIAV
ncbi:MAG: hypothetical protein ABID35_07865, partial [Candidatus Margulisiibacteriota bacterium]